MRIYPLILISISHNHSLNNHNNSSSTINHSSNITWQCISTTISKCSIIQPTSLLIIWSRLNMNFPRKNHRI